MNFIHDLDYMSLKDMHPYILMLAFTISRTIKIKNTIELGEVEAGEN